MIDYSKLGVVGKVDEEVKIEKYRECLYLGERKKKIN